MIESTPLDTGHGHVNYINYNSLVLDILKPHFYSGFSTFNTPKKSFNMNNKQKSDDNCVKMIMSKNSINFGESENSNYVNYVLKCCKSHIKTFRKLTNLEGIYAWARCRKALKYYFKDEIIEQKDWRSYIVKLKEVKQCDKT